MKRTTDETALLTRYLLGDLSEEEQVSLEEQFFANDDMYQQLTALEDELRYDYSQGGLTAVQRAQFEKRFLTTPGDRRRVELAKAVLAKATESAKLNAALEPSRPWWASFVQFFTTPVSLASTVAAVSALGAVLFFSQTVNLRQELNQVQSRGSADQIALNEQKSQGDSLRRELQQERTRREQLEQGSASQKPASRRFLVAFALAPGLLRDTDGPKRLRVPAGADEVRLQLDLKAPVPSPDLRASLQNLEGQELWSQDAKAAGSAVTLVLPARLLPPGDYMVDLKGRGATADGARSNEYYFTVVR